MKKYIFYKTINKVNNKYYYGSHHGYENDGYLGSGVILHQAILKYGLSNFIRYDLRYFDSDTELYAFEDRFLKLFNLSEDNNCYNIKNAALGGNTLLSYSQEEIDLINERRSITLKNHYQNINRKISEETKKKIGDANRGQKRSPRPDTVKEKISKTLTGRTYSDTRRANMSKAAKNRPYVTCPHCGKVGKKGRNMTVYHFDNCKHRA